MVRFSVLFHAWDSVRLPLVSRGSLRLWKKRIADCYRWLSPRCSVAECRRANEKNDLGGLVKVDEDGDDEINHPVL